MVGVYIDLFWHRDADSDDGKVTTLPWLSLLWHSAGNGFVKESTRATAVCFCASSFILPIIGAVAVLLKANQKALQLFAIQKPSDISSCIYCFDAHLIRVSILIVMFLIEIYVTLKNIFSMFEHIARV